MNTNIMKLALVTSMMVALSACKGYHSAKKSSGKGGTPVVKPKELAPVDAECPANSEGLWNIQNAQQESFGIGRNAQGVLQMTFATLADSIVLDGKSRTIAFKDGSGTGATIHAKCAESVIFVSVKNVTDKEGNETVSTYEYRLSSEEKMGNVTEIVDGKKSVHVILKNQ